MYFVFTIDKYKAIGIVNSQGCIFKPYFIKMMDLILILEAIYSAGIYP